MLLCVCVCAHMCAQANLGSFVSFREDVFLFGETAADKLEISTHGVLRETFDSANVFVRQLTVAFHPACHQWNRDGGRAAGTTFVCLKMINTFSLKVIACLGAAVSLHRYLLFF